MRESFYRYLMTQKNPDSSEVIAQFANNAFHDQAFPKQATDYEELSNYLELNGNYLPEMAIFDEAYQAYLDKMN